MRDIAPTTALRKWYDHDVDRWPEFRKRYARELGDHRELLDLVLDIAQHRKQVTLLFAARDIDHNEAQVLADVLRDAPAHPHGR